MSGFRNVKGRFALLVLFALSFGLLLPGDGQTAVVRERRGHEREFLDSRYHHDRYYPRRGYFVRVLPPSSRHIVYGDRRYYFDRGTWYRREGVRFIVVAPPFGMIIPFLPPYYETIWVDGVPYYYANEVYYMRGADGYVVVTPPQEGKVSETPPPAPESQLFVYPRQGQSEKQQADDRYACHIWAVKQTGYDPTQPPPDKTKSPTDLKQKRDEYKRAFSACLEGRGYTVK